MIRFGEKLRLLRNARGMTLVELAGELGLKSHGYLSELESGRKTPTVEIVLGVSTLFDVPTDDLLRDDREVKPCP